MNKKIKCDGRLCSYVRMVNAMSEGIIDKARNPFATPHWIDQGYGLTYEKKRNRQEDLPDLFSKTVEEIEEIKANDGKYLAFVGIRWGFARLINNKLVPTEIWENRAKYDEYGKFL